MTNKKNNQGFSLIELLVVIAIFITVLLIITDIFMSVTQSQRRVIAWQKAQSELRYDLEIMAQEIRTGTINYNEYSSPVNVPEDELKLLNSENETVYYRYSDSGCSGANSCLQRSQGGSWGDVSSSGIEITRLDFYISPGKDPFKYDEGTKEYLASAQPRVTIILEAKSTGVIVEDEKTMSIQTTISTRSYER